MDAAGEAIAALVPATLHALRRLEQAARHFDPATPEAAIAALSDAAAAPEAALAAPRAPGHAPHSGSTLASSASTAPIHIA